MVQSEMGAQDCFHSWKCLVLCLYNVLSGFATLAKTDNWSVRKYNFVALMHRLAQQVLAGSER